MTYIRQWIALIESEQNLAKILADRVSAMNLPARITVHPLDDFTAEITEACPMWDEDVDGGLDQNALERWYQRLGFRHVPSRDANSDLEFDRYMVRPPRGTPS